MLRDVVKVIEQRRVDRVLFAVAIIAQQHLDGRERLGHVGVAATEHDVERLRRVQILEREALDGRCDSCVRARARGRASTPAADAPASQRTRFEHPAAAPVSMRLTARLLSRSSRPRSSASTVARGKKLNSEARCPGVGAHHAPDHEIALLELRQLDVLADHVDAVAGRAGEHRRVGGPGRRQRLDRVGRVIVHLAAVAAVQAVVEVIPPAPVALRAPHHRGHRHRGGRRDVAARLGDDAHCGVRASSRPGEWARRTPRWGPARPCR